MKQCNFQCPAQVSIAAVVSWPAMSKVIKSSRSCLHSQPMEVWWEGLYLHQSTDLFRLFQMSKLDSGQGGLLFATAVSSHIREPTPNTWAGWNSWNSLMVIRCCPPPKVKWNVENGAWTKLQSNLSFAFLYSFAFLSTFPGLGTSCIYCILVESEKIASPLSDVWAEITRHNLDPHDCNPQNSAASGCRHVWFQKETLSWNGQDFESFSQLCIVLAKRENDWIPLVWKSQCLSFFPSRLPAFLSHYSWGSGQQRLKRM